MRTRFSKTEGVVLNSVKFGDGHKIVNILTEGYGKVEASAFGVRKTKSRFGSRLEPFTVAHFLLYRKTEDTLFTIREADVVSSNALVREDLSRFILGSCMIEPIVRFVERAEVDRRLYRLLAASLSILGEIEPERGIYLLSMYDVKFLDVLGYGTGAASCAKCGLPFEEGARAYADRSFGFPVCERCKTSSCAALSEGARAFVAWAGKSELMRAAKVTMKRETIRGVRNAIESLYLLAFHKTPQSWNQLGEIPFHHGLRSE